MSPAGFEPPIQATRAAELRLRHRGHGVRLEVEVKKTLKTFAS